MLRVATVACSSSAIAVICASDSAIGRPDAAASMGLTGLS
jgi:hypothetical protein